MPTRTSLEAEGWSQNKQRINGIFYDQHKDSTYEFPPGHPRAGQKPFLNGRPWWGPCEKSATGIAMPMPVGDLTPMGWVAPWYPDMKYIAASIGRVNSDGMVVVGDSGLFEARFRIDYVQMKGDYETAMREYYNKAVNEAAAIGQPGPDYGGAISYQLRQRVGKPPKSPKIPEAALAGNKWLLGQLPAQFNSRTQRWEVEEDEQLARLLSHGDITVATAEQAIARNDRLADMEKQLAAVLAQLAEKQAAPPAPKPMGAYQKFVQEQNAAGIKDMKVIGAKWRGFKEASAAR